MYKSKKVSILIWTLFLLVISSFLVLGDTCAYDSANLYEASLGVGHDLKDCQYTSDEPITSLFAYDLDDNGHMADMRDLSTNCGSDLIIKYKDYDFGYNPYSLVDELPYKLISCYVVCDNNNVAFDYFWSFDIDETDNILTSDTTRFQSAYDCYYNSYYEGTNVTQEFGCGVIRNPNDLDYLDPCQIGVTSNNCNYFRGDSTYYCIDSYEVTLYIGYSNGTSSGTGNTSIGGYDLNTTTDHSTGGIGDDNDAGEQDNQGLQKQSKYEDLKSDVKKKNKVFDTMNNIMYVIFSLILIGFYIIELVAVIYVFTSWIPDIMFSAVTILKKFKGDT